MVLACEGLSLHCSILYFNWSQPELVSPCAHYLTKLLFERGTPLLSFAYQSLLLSMLAVQDGCDQLDIPLPLS